jgi:uncharacterized protein YcfJ
MIGEEITVVRPVPLPLAVAGGALAPLAGGMVGSAVGRAFKHTEAGAIVGAMIGGAALAALVSHLPFSERKVDSAQLRFP